MVNIDHLYLQNYLLVRLSFSKNISKFQIVTFENGLSYEMNFKTA